MEINNINPGDVVYVDRGLYKHYGVYAGGGKIIHFAPLAGNEINAENAVVHETELNNFLKGGMPETDRKSRAQFSPPEIVNRARSQIGNKGYNLVFYNCEHFAQWCKTGVFESNQVKSVIDLAVEGAAYGMDLISGNADPKDGERLLRKISNYFIKKS